MQRASRDIIIGVVSGLVVTVIERIARELTGAPAMEHLTRIIAMLYPELVGLMVGLVIWAVLSIRRVTKGRDDEFKRWLHSQENRISENFTNQFREMAANTETIRLANIAAMETFHEAFERRLSAVENNLKKDHNP